MYLLGKNGAAVASLLVCLTHSNIGYASTPVVCQSPDSDPDGDGWGWENNASCVVEGTSAESSATVSTVNECAFLSSDMDGDGWGWENGTSCRISESSGAGQPEAQSSNYEPVFDNSGKLVCQLAESDPDNDGYGWENNASCIVPGTLAEAAQTKPQHPICSSSAFDPDGDGWGWENNATCIADGSTTEDQISEDQTSGDDNDAGEVADQSGDDQAEQSDEAGAQDNSATEEEAAGESETGSNTGAGVVDNSGNQNEGSEAVDNTANQNEGSEETPVSPPDSGTGDSGTDDSSTGESENPTDTSTPENSDADTDNASVGESETEETEEAEETDASEGTESDGGNADSSEVDSTAENTYLPADITDLILITGQSNTMGSNAAVDEILDASNPRVFAYTSEGWDVASLYQKWDNGAHPGNGFADDWFSSHNNFALHFGKQLAALDPSAVVGFILVSEPGEGIEHWSAGKTGMSRVQEKTLAAINELPHKSGIDGVLWHQGETDWQLEGTSDPDVQQPAAIDYYPVQLNMLIQNLRLEPWLDATQPFICGETINADGVNTHLMALNSDDDAATACVEGAGLPSITESGNHLNAEALRTIGARYAQKYHELTR
jgi:hypothetical protein